MFDEVFCRDCAHCDNDIYKNEKKAIVVYDFCNLDMENFTLDDSIECENFECNNEE